ncbi:uncharacterized protein LOC124819284 [Hydra vulgaris]|uniref:uncharacterized protein LOC124819284 n=1 Tax=Hydra vulgaris TaxID=6087 RepID=UPI001F5EBFD2|nr:uncharacterized protein LOC124819284 [Hydra vulgaris]
MFKGKCETGDEEDYDIIESPDTTKKRIKHSVDVIYKEETHLSDSESMKETKNKEIVLLEETKNNQTTKKQSPDEIANLTLTNENTVILQNINLNVSKLQENDVKKTDSLKVKETETDRLIGRFVAGLGDSWYYVILLEQTKSSSSLISNRKMATECLASFVIGIILSPGINILASYLKFDVLKFRINGENSSGLIMASLFFIMLLNNAFFLKGYTSKIKSKKSSLFPQNNECATENNLFVKIVVTGIYFLYYYIVTFLELMIPILIYESMKLSVIGSIHVYAIISVLYGLILIVIVQVSHVKYLQIFLTLSSIIEAVSIIGVYILHQNSHIASNIEHTILFFSPVCFSLSLLWANSDGLFISLLQTYVSEDVRDCTHSTGKSVSKLAIVWAVITVVFYSRKTSTVITMTIMTLILIAYVAQLFIYYRKKKLNPINKRD